MRYTVTHYIHTLNIRSHPWHAIAEWTDVSARLTATMANCEISQIQRVQNLHLWDYYCLRQERMLRLAGNREPNVVSVWHGTRTTDPRVIYEDEADGFMMQYSNEGMWGRGLYFAENASYSDSYAHVSQGNKCILLVKLLAGEETRVMPHDRSLTICPNKPGKGRYDTVTGETNGSKVYIVYENGRAYPQYVVTYRK